MASEFVGISGEEVRCPRVFAPKGTGLSDNVELCVYKSSMYKTNKNVFHRRTIVSLHVFISWRKKHKAKSGFV